MHLPSVVLTPEEKKALIFVVIAFALGFATMHYRDNHRLVAPSEAQSQSKAKPSPAEADE